VKKNKPANIGLSHPSLLGLLGQKLSHTNLFKHKNTFIPNEASYIRTLDNISPATAAAAAAAAAAPAAAAACYVTICQINFGLP
jgi:hypothetical protein